MPQESKPALFNLIPQPPIPEMDDDLQEVFEMVAAGLYSLAAMLVGEGEESVRLVEDAVANAEVSVCQNPEIARRSSRRGLCAAALEVLGQRDPASLTAPAGLTSASVCIDEDDLAAAGISSEELEGMIAGPERNRVREWLESLPTWMRVVFVLRAVAGLSATETAKLLKDHAGPEAAEWTPEAAREVFRQGLCSLASQLLQASNGR
jgi:DNA-directed RNA polymerase specialized sigma24 family protein